MVHAVARDLKRMKEKSTVNRDLKEKLTTDSTPFYCESSRRQPGRSREIDRKLDSGVSSALYFYFSLEK